MSKQAFPFHFDVKQKLDAIVSINAYVPANSYSADLLGTERKGHGIVIRDDGLIITIGYVVTEAETVWIDTDKSKAVPGYIISNDFESGLGLIKPTAPLDLPAMEFGRLADLHVDDTVLIAGHGEPENMVVSRVTSKKQFAGRWEYVLDEAIYVSPVHPDWAGTALIGRDGKLYGVGCLLIQDMKAGELINGSNLFVPVETIVPVFDELIEFGGRRKKPRPWLGALVQEELSQLVVVGIFYKCPADQAGLKPGDVILALDGKPVYDLAAFFRAVWSMGGSGVEIPLTIQRETGQLDVIIKSGDRESSFRRGSIN
jgi:S1-C subfamily serine protease